MGSPQYENILDFDLIKRNIITLDEFHLFDNISIDITLLLKSNDLLNENEIILKNVLLKIEKYCEWYEQQIRSMGGIDFFLGGIGPDGHIGV